MGWSTNLEYNIASNDPYDDDSYIKGYGTWYMRTWWSSFRLARKYENKTSTVVKLKSISFVACPGHSNGKSYGTSTGLSTQPAGGYGCTFAVNLYVNDGKGNWTKLENIEVGQVLSINRYNCYYGGYGNTSTDTQFTSFGDVSLFGPGTGYSLDAHDPGRKRYRYEHTLDLSPYMNDVPVVPPGGYMYVHVYPKKWASGSTNLNSLLVIEFDDNNFSSVLEEADSDYIWVMTAEGWKRERIAYMCVYDEAKKKKVWLPLKG